MLRDVYTSPIGYTLSLEIKQDANRTESWNIYQLIFFRKKPPGNHYVLYACISLFNVGLEKQYTTTDKNRLEKNRLIKIEMKIQPNTTFTITELHTGLGKS